MFKSFFLILLFGMIIQQSPAQQLDVNKGDTLLFGQPSRNAFQGGIYEYVSYAKKYTKNLRKLSGSYNDLTQLFAIVDKVKVKKGRRYFLLSAQYIDGGNVDYELVTYDLENAIASGEVIQVNDIYTISEHFITDPQNLDLFNDCIDAMKAERTYEWNYAHLLIVDFYVNP